MLKKYDVPFAIYVPTSFPDRIGELWWLALEAVIAQNELHRRCASTAATSWFECRSVREKRAAVRPHLLRGCAACKTEDELRQVVRDLTARYRVDIAAFCADAVHDLGGDRRARRRSAGDDRRAHGQPLMLTKLDDKAVRSGAGQEPRRDRGGARQAAGASGLSGRRPTSAGPREFRIAAELGFKTAVTTRPGVVFRQHAEHLTALPRISLNGEFQRPRYAKVLISGAATALWNGFRPVNVT